MGNRSSTLCVTVCVCVCVCVCVVQLTGAAVFSLGIWIRSDVDLGNQIFGPNDVLPDHMEAYLLISIGAVVMIISFFACIGALLENQCMLAMVKYRVAQKSKPLTRIIIKSH